MTLNTLVLCLNRVSTATKSCECGNLWDLLLLKFGLQYHRNANCYSLVIELCSFTKSSKVSSSGLEVLRRPMLSKASSISRDVHMC